MKRVILVATIVLAIAACKKTENYNATNTTGTSTTETTASSTSGTAPATATTATMALTDKDKDFVTTAGKGGKAEVELAQDAVSHATNPDVKAFAQKLIEDHTKANTDLGQIAASKGVTIPSEAEAKMKEAKERIEKLTGKTFDEAFVKQMVEDHKSTIKLFEDESKAAADPDIKKFAESTLPTLREHLKKAEGLEKTVAKKK